MVTLMSLARIAVKHLSVLLSAAEAACIVRIAKESINGYRKYAYYSNFQFMAAILLTIIFNHKIQELFGYDVSIQIKESKIQSLVVPQCMADMVFIEDKKQIPYPFDGF